MLDHGHAPATSVTTFFLLVYVVTWTSWVAALALGDATSPLFMLGVFAPSIVAVWLTARHDGRDGVGALLGRLFQWRVGLLWYVFAISYMAAIKLTVAGIHRVATGEWPRFGHEAWYVMLAATLFSTIVLGQAGEEVGWRGYALPRLAARFGLGRASIMLGIIWALWHLPLFFIPGTDTTGQSFLLYLLQVTALSVAIAWLYARTNGSLLLTMLLHAAVNNTKDIVPSAVEGATNPFALSTSRVAWITVGLLWLAAAFFLTRMPEGDLSMYAIHPVRKAGA